MSQANVDIVRRTFEAVRRRDVEGLLELYHADVEYLPLTGTRVESGGYVGHLGVRQYFEEISEVWDEMLPHAEDIRPVGDDLVVAIGGCAVRGRGSGAITDNPMAWVISLRDGKVARHCGYRTAEEALEAAGLGD